MTRAESKYFATAAKMDEAFLKLLESKDFAYITVKELCAAAGVNRSTFYLHYETISDLLAESVAYMNGQFLSYMEQDAETFIGKLKSCPMDELYLVTPEYLVPYLSYIRDHKRLFRTAMENAKVLGLSQTYDRMFQHVFTPILDRYAVPEADRGYIMTFYIRGLLGLIEEWVKADCSVSIDELISVIQKCIARR